MKQSIKLTDIGSLKNELRKYKAGKKLDIAQFNQVARLAWLGKLVIQPLDPADPECKAWLVFVDHPDELAGHVLNLDADLVGQMHIIDAQQGEALIKALELGVKERAALYQDLDQRDFYFQNFYQGSGKKTNHDPSHHRGPPAEADHRHEH